MFGSVLFPAGLTHFCIKETRHVKAVLVYSTGSRLGGAGGGRCGKDKQLRQARRAPRGPRSWDSFSRTGNVALALLHAAPIRQLAAIVLCAAAILLLRPIRKK